MRFLPKTTCEKLVKMGLKSTTEFLYLKTDKPVYALDSEPGYVAPAFTLEDFVSTDEYAKENCRKLFGNLNHISMPKGFDGPLIDKGKVFLEKRHEIINSEDWVEFISKAMEERSKTL